MTRVRAAKETPFETSRARVYRHVVIAGICVVVVLPILPLLIQSFSRQWFYPALVPPALDLRAWRYILAPEARVLRATLNSLAIALIVTILCILIGVPAGRGLAAAAPKFRRRAEFLFLAPMIVPSLAVALGLHVSFLRLGLADRMLGVIIAHLLPALPYMVLVMTSTFASAEQELESQARTLGSGPITAFLLVGVRSALPGIVTGSLFVFLISWSQYALTLLIGGGRVLTLPLVLFAFASAGDMSLTAALAIVFLIPAIIILAFTSRFLTGRSVSLGGVGGR
jgi:putative spermidine/putrescine transport system permease protein